jgi:hypothetical protein
MAYVCVLNPPFLYTCVLNPPILYATCVLNPPIKPAGYSQKELVGKGMGLLRGTETDPDQVGVGEIAIKPPYIYRRDA